MNVIQVTETGDPSKLLWTNAANPECGPNDLIVKLEAAASTTLMSIIAVALNRTPCRTFQDWKGQVVWRISVPSCRASAPVTASLGATRS